MKEKLKILELFVKQNKIDKENLKYDAGIVYDYSDNEFIIANEQKGAEDTFSIGQPIYDKQKNKLGYLGIGMYKNVNYYCENIEEQIPVYYWKICNYTKYCKSGVKIFTYWQNFNKFEELKKNVE